MKEYLRAGKIVICHNHFKGGVKNIRKDIWKSN